MTAPRRTQAERRASTIGLLLDATIGALAEVGYARTSVSEICARAGVSQGALFRHFATRRDVVAAATDEIAKRHVLRFADTFARADDGELDPEALGRVVRFIREVARSPSHAAWREVMVAARTDHELRGAVRDALGRYEAALLEATCRFFGASDEHVGTELVGTEHVGTVVLSIMHMFDSEAVTVGVYPNEKIEEARVAWATRVLADALARA